MNQQQGILDLLNLDLMLAVDHRLSAISKYNAYVEAGTVARLGLISLSISLNPEVRVKAGTVQTDPLNKVKAHDWC